MKKHLFLITVITLGLFVQSSFSQDLNMLKNTPFIFKGKVTTVRGFRSKDDNSLYASYIINITDIYKGENELKLGTIEMIIKAPPSWGIAMIEGDSSSESLTLGGDPDAYYEENKYPIGFGGGETGVFVCNKNKVFLSHLKSDNNIKILTSFADVKFDNAIILEPICNTMNCFFYYGTIVKEVDNKFVEEEYIEGFGKKFSRVGKYINGRLVWDEEISVGEKFDNYLKEIGLTPKKDTNKKKELNFLDKKKENELLYAQRLKNYNNYMENLQMRMQNANNNKANSCKEFFISEYIDGPNKNKVLEIYNPTDSIKSLNGYTIKIFQNGAPTPLEIQLQGNVNPKETYVISHPNADPDILAKANQTSNKMNFDGNDAVVLNQGISNYIDKIGEIGVNPGNGGWNVPPSGSTQLHDLRRKFPIDKGETDWNQGKNQWNVFPQDSLLNVKQHQNVCSALLNNDISFSFANPTETGTSPKYFEFDIMVKANNSTTYFDNCVLKLAYNTTAFGDSIVFNNKVTIIKGANFNTVFNAATYIDPNLYIADDSTSVMRVPFGTDIYATSWNRTLVTTTPDTLIHVKIEIQYCNEYSFINFTDTGYFGTPMFSLYSLNASDDPNIILNVYDHTYYLNDLNKELCPPPVITNMFPNSITSGTNSVLTIQGSNFGNIRGTSQIWICNDENCSYTITNFNYIDYLSWSDTEIKFRVPSTVDTFPATYKYKGVGSGNVSVWTSDGLTVPNAVSHLEVPYANINKRIHYLTPAYKKIPMRVIPDYGDTTKYFYLDTSISNSPERELAVRTALRYWSCNTFINWAIKGNTISQHSEDNISVLYMDDTLHGNPLAITFFPLTMYLCADDNGDTIGYFKDIDIGFSRDFSNINATWITDTSYTQNLLPKQHDFFAVAQHELGHAHGLAHVNDTTDIMNYADKSSPVNTIPFYNRLNIYSSPDAVNGGNYIFQKSQQIHSCSGITQMIPSSASNCSSNISVSELFNKDINLLAYPNPFNDILNVSYNLKRNDVLIITMYNYTGTKIKQINLGKQNIGSHNIKINVSNISSGLYFLSVKINNRVETIKLIKQ